MWNISHFVKKSSVVSIYPVLVSLQHFCQSDVRNLTFLNITSVLFFAPHKLKSGFSSLGVYRFNSGLIVYWGEQSQWSETCLSKWLFQPYFIAGIFVLKCNIHFFIKSHFSFHQTTLWLVIHLRYLTVLGDIFHMRWSHSDVCWLVSSEKGNYSPIVKSRSCHPKDLILPSA